MKIGIVGGTFNPIHNGHLLLGETAREEFSLDEVWFMPSGVSYLKKDIDIPAGEIRLEIVNRAVAGNPYFKASDVEIKREGNTYTADTLSFLKESKPEHEYYFILGADSLFYMENWYKPEVIFQNCTVLAAIRDEVDFEQLSQKRDYLIKKYNAKIELLHYPLMDLSSSKIRQNCKEHKSIRYMVPDSVLSYIEENRMYLD